MQYTPSQLKEKLIEGIDNENNVVDMPKVLEVIFLLEKCTITREALEETRIGRLVNDVRRKTSDKQLAKKAKDLVRSWQKVVSSSESNTTVNGDGLNSGAQTAKQKGGSNYGKSPVSTLVKPAPTTPIKKLATQKSVNSSLSKGQLSSQPNTPTLQQTVNNGTPVHPSIKRSHSSSHVHPSSAKRLCRSPGTGSQPGTPDSICSQSSRASFTAIHQTPTSRSDTTQLSSGKKKIQRTQSYENLSKKRKTADIKNVHSQKDLTSDKEGKSKSQNGIIRSKSEIDIGEASTHSSENKGLKTTIRLKNPSVLNGETPQKRGRGRPPKNKPQIIASSTFEPPPCNGSSSSSKTFAERKNVHLGLKTESETPTRNDKFISMTPKVKSTAELMQSLLEKNNLSVGKDTARQISGNLILKESDESSYSVPDGAKPRQHKKKGARHELIPPSTPVSLNKTKSEMVQKFLESSMTESNPDDLSPLKYELPRTESPGNASTSFEDSVDGNQDSTKHNLMDTTRYDQTKPNSVISGGKASHRLKGEPEPCSSTDSVNQSSSAERPLTLEEIYSKYPPLDLENFVLDDDTYEVSEPVEITDGDIQRAHTGHWNGVNGCQDMFDEWTDWSQTLSLSSYKGEPLHILPYVSVDD